MNKTIITTGSLAGVALMDGSKTKTWSVAGGEVIFHT